MNKQRSIIYELRGTILMGKQEDVHGTILDVFNDLVLSQAERFLSDPKGAGMEDFMNWLGVTFPVAVGADDIKPFLGEPGKAGEFVYKLVAEAYEAKCAAEDPRVLPFMERGVFLSCIDRQWQDYLRAMDDLRHGVSLRSYGQRDPLIEYKREAFNMFENLMTTIKTEVANTEFRATTAMNMRRMLAAQQMRTNAGAFDEEQADDTPQQVGRAPARPSAPAPDASAQGKSVQDVFASMMSQVAGRPVRAVRNPAAVPGGAPAPAVGRNDPCPCGSGKKYKKCCGRNLA